jgi:Photosynthetic reaction centre cytochrome C subunit
MLLAACAVVLSAALAPLAGAQPPAASQAAPSAPAAPSAAAARSGQAQAGKFLNVQTLKELSAAQMHDAMVFMTVAVGTNCEGCHVRGADGKLAFDKDDKRSKGTTRKMIDMVNAINARDFNGESQVNCMTCHQGRLSPIGIPQLAQPVVATSPTSPGPTAAGPAAPSPGAPAGSGAPPASAPGGRPKPPAEPVAQVLAKFVDALGGRDALAAITSRTRKGTVTNRAGQTSPVTIDEKGTGFYLASVGSTPPSSRGMSPAGAWTATTEGTRGLEGVEASALAVASDLTLPVDMATRYTGLQARAYASIDGHDVIVLVGRSSPDVTETLSFDRASGLLLRRVVRFTLSMGRLPVQVDYSDYRAVGGVKMPFEVKVTDWATISAARFTDIVLNPALDDARFARPADRHP